MQRIALLIIACVASLGCGNDDFADDPMILQAQAWSGSTQRPLCRRTGPDGEDLGSPDARYCEWRALNARERGTLTAIARDSGTLVTWQRTMTDASDADRLTDSMRTALIDRGLRERDCGTVSNLSGESRGARWESDDFVLDLTRVTPHRGVPRIQIIATDAPAEMPPVLCAPAAELPRPLSRLP